jgi:protein arginine N-methyltransferase 1
MATYDVHDYARMAADARRLRAYAEALRSAVRPGAVVVDVGAGTGVLTLLACRFGARRVFAIEPNESIVMAANLAAENGFSERIEFLQVDARSVNLPERADVVVSDLRGALPAYGDHFDVIRHAREHFLAPGGVLIPESDRLMMAVAECDDLYEHALGPATGPEGLTFGAVRQHLANCITTDRTRPLGAKNLLTTPTPWAELDYRRILPAPIEGAARCLVERFGTGHGIALWFEATLADGVRYSSAPAHDAVYSRAFLPWPRPIPLESGDSVSVEFWCQAAGEPWGWTTTIDGTRAGSLTFRQSSFLAALSPPGRTGASLGKPRSTKMRRKAPRRAR